MMLRNVILAFALLTSLAGSSEAGAQEQIALEATSDQGTFTVEILWTPRDIGMANLFDIHFIEPETGEEIEGVIYDISLYSEGIRETLRRDQTVTRQEFMFDKPGSYELRIDDIEGLGERVAIPIQVTPEFSPGAAALAAVAIGVAALLARSHRNDLFSLKAK